MYLLMADGKRWLDLSPKMMASRWNLSEAVKLGTRLQQLGYEHVYIICTG